MEQRIGSSSQPLEGAGFDPAFIPGLTSPVSGKPEDAKPKKAVEDQADVDVEAPVEDEAPEETSAEAEEAQEAEEADDADGASAEAGEADDASAEAGKAGEAEEAQEAEESEGAAETEGAEEEEVPDGPVFEASDRRAQIVADHEGVRLSLDDQHCEFRWDEIGAIETETPRFGKRFTVTVHTPDNRWYPIEIEAPSRSHFEEWESELDDVLDAYFEEGTSEEDDSEPEDNEAEDNEAEESAP